MFAAIKKLFLFDSGGGGGESGDVNSVMLPAQVRRVLNKQFTYYPIDPTMPFKSDSDGVVIMLLQVAPNLPHYEEMAELNFMHAVVFIDEPELPSNKADPLYGKKIEALETATLQSLALEFSSNNTQPVGDAIVYYRYSSMTAPTKQLYVVLYCLQTNSCSTLPVALQLCAGECRAVLIAALTDAYSAIGVTFECKRCFKITADAKPISDANAAAAAAAAAAADTKVCVVGVSTYRNAAVVLPEGMHIISINLGYNFTSWWPSQVPLSVISRRYVRWCAKPTDQLTDLTVLRKWLDNGYYSSITLLLKFKALAARWPGIKTFTNAEANNAIRDYVANYKDEQRSPVVAAVATAPAANVIVAASLSESLSLLGDDSAATAKTMHSAAEQSANGV